MKKMSWNFSLLIFLSLAFSVTTYSAEVTKAELVEKGINLLFDKQVATPGCEEHQACPDQIDLNEVVKDSLQFQQRYLDIIANYSLTGFKLAQKSKYVQSFEFDSPKQVPNSKANKVYGFIYRPDPPSGCAGFNFPATLIIHHVANDISDEQSFAKLAAQSNKGIVMLIYLPRYGPRAESPDAKHFPDSLEEFRESLFQSLLDIHVAASILAEQPQVDKNQLQLGGLSLGAVISAIFAGFDNSFFSNYLIGLGGGDVGRILTLDKKIETTSEVKKALENVNWNPDYARLRFAPLDPLTWAYAIQNKKITIINASDDELIHHEYSFIKFKDALSQGNNRVRISQHEGMHVPNRRQLGLKKYIGVYFDLYKELFSFLGGNNSTDISSCDVYKN